METESDSHVPWAASVQLSTPVPGTDMWEDATYPSPTWPIHCSAFCAGRGWETKSLHSIQGPNCPGALSADWAMMEKPARGEDQMGSLCPGTVTDSLSVSPDHVTSKCQFPAPPDSTAWPTLGWCRGRGRKRDKQPGSPAFPALLAQPFTQCSSSHAPGVLAPRRLGTVLFESATFPPHWSVTWVCPYLACAKCLPC